MPMSLTNQVVEEGQHPALGTSSQALRSKMTEESKYSQTKATYLTLILEAIKVNNLFYECEKV